MSATLRYRGEKNNIIELAKNLDAFKKVPEKYTETTEIGGTLSLLSRLLIIYLIYKEFRYYNEANLVYHFVPDTDMDDKVQMMVDITVAMPCTSLSGVDLMDETRQDVFAYGTLQREGTWWTMPKTQREEFERMQHLNLFLREEYHSIADILFKDIIKNGKEHKQEPTVNGKPLPEENYDACRLHGTLGINKVAGVLHLVGGAQPMIGLFDDHWMIEFKRVPANFSHRINRLSFGQYSKHIVQPLEGDETFISDEATKVQYFLKIVPTEIHNTFSTISTYQYSVTENIRKLDSERNSYGSPGIYFKYDWSALKIVVRTDRDNLLQFIIRLSSVIAGIIVISGILNSILLKMQYIFIRTFAPQYLYKQLKSTAVITRLEFQSPPVSYPSSNPIMVPVKNELLNMANAMSKTTETPHTLLPTVGPSQH